MSEIDYQRVFEATTTPYLVLDADGFQILAANDAYLSATMTTREALVGKFIFEAFPDNPDDAEATGVRNLRASLERVATTAQPDVMALQKYDIADGDGRFEERYWSPVNAPVLSDDGRLELIIHRVEDVTDYVRLRGTGDRRRIEEVEAELLSRSRELAERNEQLRHEHEAKDRFLAMLSHELRNPLAALRGALEVLDELSGGAEPDGMVDVARRQVDALHRMTDDLLDASRAMAGKLQLVRCRVDAGLLAEQALEVALANEGGADREVGIVTPDEPAWVNGDPIRVVQAVGNLISNAMRATKPGGRIEVTVDATADVVIEVRDDGHGFDPARVETLFEVFAQSDTSLARERPGLGLGLPIARTIADMHGGRIEARSNGPGRGACFALVLPRSDGPVTNSAPSPQHPANECLQILLIEDNADVAASYTRLLTQLGHHVEHADCGRAGIDTALKLQPDVVVCDIGLPDIDGYEVGRRLREDERMASAVLIIMSGYGRSGDKTRSADAGFREHLVKPVSREALAAALSNKAKPTR